MELIRPILHHELGGVQTSRKKTIIHCSDLTNDTFCPREHYLHTQQDHLAPYQIVSTATFITWQYGRYVETEFRNNWLVDYMVGNWKCVRCDKYFSEFCAIQQLGQCDCATGLHLDYIEYCEPVFRINALNFQGSPDCFFHDGKSTAIIPIEIKTIDKDAFALLTEPRKEHILRCQVYLKLLAETTQFCTDLRSTICTEYMQIVYFSKAFGIRDDKIKQYNTFDRGYSPIKEFTVMRDDANIQHLWDKLTDYNAAIANNVLPDKITQCKTVNSTRAKQCNVAKKCFSL